MNINSLQTKTHSLQANSLLATNQKPPKELEDKIYKYVKESKNIRKLA